MSEITITNLKRPITEGQPAVVTGRNKDNQVVKITIAWNDWPLLKQLNPVVGNRVTYDAATRVWKRV